MVGQQPVPVAQQLCTANFRGHPNSSLISNEIKACLDDIYLTMQGEPNARLFIVGHFRAGESSNVAAQRAVNAMYYLTQDKGVMPGQIVALFGGSVHEQSVTMFLVPPNAVFTQESAAVAVPKSVKPIKCDLYSDNPANGCTPR